MQALSQAVFILAFAVPPVAVVLGAIVLATLRASTRPAAAREEVAVL
jgi:hypothetical protein